MKPIVLFTFFLTLLGAVITSSSEIVEVRLSIPMSNDEKQVKDYYLSTEGVSLKKNLVVNVIRPIKVINHSKQTVGEIKAEIAQLRVISVSDKVAVAREHKIFTKENTPLTDALGILVGDQIDTKDSFITEPARKPSAETAAALPQKPEGPTSMDPAHAKPVEIPIIINTPENI